MDHNWRDWERCLGRKRLELSSRQQAVTGATYASCIDAEQEYAKDSMPSTPQNYRVIVTAKHVSHSRSTSLPFEDGFEVFEGAGVFGLA
jgi:hypothetical protein